MGYSHATMSRAAVYAEPGTTKIDIVSLPIPTPAVGELLVRIKYSGVCHTDYSFCTNGFTGIPLTPKGQVGGHEGVGEVVAVGEGVRSFVVGSKVGIKYTAYACLNCENCLIGGESSCVNLKISGYFTPGTFQQYCLTSAQYATAIPDNLDMAAAAPLMCGGVSVYAGLKRGQVQVGDWVVISGAGGGLGHFAIQYAKAMGARVLGIDSKSKETFCRELGVDEFIDFMEFHEDESLRSRIHEITGGGAKIVLMCSASSKAYVQSPSWLRFRGTVVALGVPPAGSPNVANIEKFITLELRIIGVKTGDRLEMKESLDIAARGLVKTHYQLRKLEDLETVFHEMEEGKVTGRIVLDLS